MAHVVRTRILRLPEVVNRVGVSRTTIYTWAASGRFPKPIVLGAKAVGWREPDVENWLASRPEAVLAHCGPYTPVE